MEALLNLENVTASTELASLIRMPNHTHLRFSFCGKIIPSCGTIWLLPEEGYSFFCMVFMIMHTNLPTEQPPFCPLIIKCAINHKASITWHEKTNISSKNLITNGGHYWFSTSGSSDKMWPKFIKILLMCIVVLAEVVSKWLLICCGCRRAVWGSPMGLRLLHVAAVVGLLLALKKSRTMGWF